MRTIFTTGNSRSQRLMVRGGLLVAGVLAVGALAGLADRASANDASASGAMSTAALRAVWDSMGAVRGALTVTEMELDRAKAIIAYSSTYQIPADLSGAIYDIALSEGINPAIGFRLVQIESGFDAKAKSRVGAIGYTQSGRPDKAKAPRCGLREAFTRSPTTPCQGLLTKLAAWNDLRRSVLPIRLTRLFQRGNLTSRICTMPSSVHRVFSYCGFPQMLEC